MICWKIRIFAYWTTPHGRRQPLRQPLWFAEKFVSLLIEQHRGDFTVEITFSCDLLKNSYLCLLNNTTERYYRNVGKLWFAEKFVSLLIEQHRKSPSRPPAPSCDLLKNSYLCLLNNTKDAVACPHCVVVICWKIRIFAYWTTPYNGTFKQATLLWFAEKFVSLLIEQHLLELRDEPWAGCDLLKNSYLCLLNNTARCGLSTFLSVVICWKIRIFAYWTTPPIIKGGRASVLWFAEKFVSLLIEQHPRLRLGRRQPVVICWKIRIFAYWTTPFPIVLIPLAVLWFAEKFVSLLIEQHLLSLPVLSQRRCDLLKNSYLCLLNNTYFHI